jgi:hypothetical protein
MFRILLLSNVWCTQRPDTCLLMDIPYRTFIKGPLSSKIIYHKENKNPFISLSYSLEVLVWSRCKTARFGKPRVHEAYHMI